MTFSRRAFDGESSPGIGRAAAVWPEFKREQVRRKRCLDPSALGPAPLSRTSGAGHALRPRDAMRPGELRGCVDPDSRAAHQKRTSIPASQQISSHVTTLRRTTRQLIQSRIVR